MSKKTSKQLTYWLGVAAVGLIVGLGVQFTIAWVEPPAGTAPPANNVGAPINASGISQYKAGALGVGGLLRGYMTPISAVFDGNVGIGTTNPQDLLHLFGPDPHLQIGFSGTPTGGFSALEFSDTNGSINARVEYQLAGENLLLDYDNDLDGVGNFIVEKGYNQTPQLIILNNGNVGIGTTSPQSALHVPDGRYAQFQDNNAGAPPAADCDNDAERGKLSIDTTNNRLYICNGATRGWDYVSLTN